jgi:hypothetical protein
MISAKNQCSQYDQPVAVAALAVEEPAQQLEDEVLGLQLANQLRQQLQSQRPGGRCMLPELRVYRRRRRRMMMVRRWRRCMMMVMNHRWRWRGRLNPVVILDNDTA